MPAKTEQRPRPGTGRARPDGASAPGLPGQEIPGELVRSVRDGLGLSRQNFGRLTGCSERAISRWEHGEPLNGANLQRMREIRNLQQELSDLMEPAAIRQWLLSPNRIFDGLTPLEVVEQGGIHHIWRTIFQLQEGVAS